MSIETNPTEPYTTTTPPGQNGYDSDLLPEIPRRRGRRLVLIGLVVLLLIGAGAVAANLLLAKPAVQTYTVQRGEIRSTVETNGKLAAQTSADLSFKNGGRLVRILVHEGDQVAAGAVLAELDTDTPARQLKQAQTDLAIAQLKLQQGKDGPRPQEIAQAQADLDAALAALAAAKGGGTAQDIAAAQAALNEAIAKRDEVKKGPTKQQITSAQATLNAAQANLAKVKKGPTADEIAAAQADVQQAQAGLDKAKKGPTADDIAAAAAAVRQAQANLDKVKQPGRPEDVAAAAAAVRQAQANLDKLKAGPTASDLAAAQSHVDQAKASKDQTAATLSNAKEQARLQLDQAGNAVRDAQDKLNEAAQIYIPRKGQQNILNPDGTFNKDATQQQIDTYNAALRAEQDAEGNMQQAQLAYDAAKQNEIAGLQQADSAIQEAQAALEKLQAGPTAQDIAAAQSAVDQAQAQLDKVKNGATAPDIAAAQAAVDQAQAQLDKLKAGPTPEDVAAAQAVVDQAQAKLRQLQSGPTPEDLAAAQADVDKAQAALDELRAGPNAEQLREAQAAVDQAQAQLDKVKQGATKDDVDQAQARVNAAQAALDLKKQGATSTDIAILAQQVQQAQYGVDSAQAALADARLVAPFAGTVLTINPQAGEMIGGGQAVLTLANLGTVRASADIDELDVGQVQPGQAVTVTLDAYPGEKLPGTVETLAPGATQKQGSTVYNATIVFTPTAGVVPRVGMAADLLITARYKPDVLLVPNRALQTIGNRQYVTVLDGDTQRNQKVTTGMTNNDSTEIIDDGSLHPGQVVLLR